MVKIRAKKYENWSFLSVFLSFFFLIIINYGRKKKWVNFKLPYFTVKSLLWLKVFKCYMEFRVVYIILVWKKKNFVRKVICEFFSSFSFFFLSNEKILVLSSCLLKKIIQRKQEEKYNWIISFFKEYYLLLISWREAPSLYFTAVLLF